jgi:hypothetical protein
MKPEKKINLDDAAKMMQEIGDMLRSIAQENKPKEKTLTKKLVDSIIWN